MISKISFNDLCASFDFTRNLLRKKTKAICIIFAESLDENAILSMRLDPEGHITEVLKTRNNSELKNIQSDAETIVLIPSSWSSLFELDLPKLSLTKWQTAIPYALEDKLAQNVETLSFTVHRQSKESKQALIIVTDTARLNNLIETFDAQEISFHSLTLDWFALNPEECCFSPNHLLINDLNFKGTLNPKHAAAYFQENSHAKQSWCFADSVNHVPDELKASVKISKLSFNEWIGSRIYLCSKPDLSRGLKKKNAYPNQIKTWYLRCALLLGIYMFSNTGFQIINLRLLSHQIQNLDIDLKENYQKFFPEAENTTDPRLKITQLLASTSTTEQSKLFWTFLGRLTESYAQSPFELEAFHYQNQKLNLSLLCQDFTALESIKKQLQQPPIKLMQSQAIAKKDQIIATMELHL